MGSAGTGEPNDIFIEFRIDESCKDSKEALVSVWIRLGRLCLYPEDDLRKWRDHAAEIEQNPRLAEALTRTIVLLEDANNLVEQNIGRLPKNTILQQALFQLLQHDQPNNENASLCGKRRPPFTNNLFGHHLRMLMC